MPNDNFVPPAPGQALPTPPPEVLANITFDDEPSVTPEQNPVSPETPATPEAPVAPETKEVAPASPETKVATDSALPSRFETETDIQYELRTKLFITGRAKANAETPEEKSILQQEMKRLRGEIAKVNQTETPTPPTPQPVAEDERAIAIKTVKDLGFKTADEVEAEVKRILSETKEREQAEQRHAEHSSAITDFYKTRDDIFIDDSKRESLESYVLDMFKTSMPTMTKAQLMQALDMSANYLFPKGAINKRIDAAQDKIDVQNIGGSQAGDSSASTLDDASKAQLRALGWSEDRIAKYGKM